MVEDSIVGVENYFWKIIFGQRSLSPTVEEPMTVTHLIDTVTESPAVTVMKFLPFIRLKP